MTLEGAPLAVAAAATSDNAITILGAAPAGDGHIVVRLIHSRSDGNSL